MFHSSNFEKVAIHRINELSSLVRLYFLWYTMPTNQRILKLCHTRTFLGWQCLGFHPLREIINTCDDIPGNKKQLMFSY